MCIICTSHFDMLIAYFSFVPIIAVLHRIKHSNNLSLVKIADFGLSDFYRPGVLMKSNCGTLSFLAPEVFRGTATAGIDT
jgi:serine/threonine protein kinase